MAKGKSICISQHPILSKAWDYDLNKGENPALRGCRSNNSFYWRCLKCGKVFAAWPDTVTNRDGYCVDCYKPIKMAKHITSMILKNGSIANVPEIMALWPEDNPNPHTICKSSELEVKIRCADCGKMVIRKVKNIYNLKQYYCDDCAEKRRRASYKKTRIDKHETCEAYPEIMAIWDWDRNTKRPEEVPAGSDQTIYLKCPICGRKWKGKPYARKNNHPCCGYCGKKQGFELRTKNFIKERGSFGDKYPHLISWWHPTKNGSLTPFEICVNDKKERYFKCPNGHEFMAKPCDMGTKRSNCPQCKPSIHTSFYGTSCRILFA